MTYEELEKSGDFTTHLAPATCRRCTECEGLEHHWIENTWDDEGPEDQPQFTCKHCDVYGEECPECGQDFMDEVVAENECEVCKGYGIIPASSSQPSAVRTFPPASQVPFWEPWIEVELVSGTPPGHRASCERSFYPHESSVVLGGENAIGQPLAHGGGQHATEAAAIVDLPLIVTEDLLVDVAFQMNRRDSDVAALDAPLEQAPEVLQPVGVDLADDVLVDVVDGGMEVVQSQPPIGGSGVRVNAGIELHVTPDSRLERVVIRVCDYLGTDFAAALKKALHNRFTDWSTAADGLRSLDLMHVLGLAPDERFVHFYLSRQLPKRASLHGQSDPVKHEPGGLLGYFQGAGKLAGTNAVLRVCDTPNGDEPLVEPQRRVLKNSPDLNAELLSAVLGLALKQRSGANYPHLLTAALWAGDFPVRVLGREHRLEAHLGVGEVADGGEQ